MRRRRSPTWPSAWRRWGYGLRQQPALRAIRYANVRFGILPAQSHALTANALRCWLKGNGTNLSVIAPWLAAIAPSPATVGEGWGGVACALACSRMSLWLLITSSNAATSGSCRSLRSHPTPTLPYFAGEGVHRGEYQVIPTCHAVGRSSSPCAETALSAQRPDDAGHCPRTSSLMSCSLEKGRAMRFFKHRRRWHQLCNA